MSDTWVLRAITILSRLPMWMWYRLSDVGYVIVYYLIKYRRKVVDKNLQASFPELSPKDRQRMTIQFYRHLCDVMVETLKSFSISDTNLTKRVHLLNPEVAQEMIHRDQGNILLASHYGNFEWMCARLDLMCQDRIPTYAVYNPFSSKLFEYLITQMRSRRGLKMLPMRYAMSKSIRQLQDFCLFGFIFDQAPHRGNRLYFTHFLHQTTAFHTSVAKIALRTQSPVYYADMRKIRRGYYELELIELPTHTFLPESKETIQAYTDLQVQHLESSIRRDPAYWLWTHRRWKYDPREGDSFSVSLEKSSS